MMPMMRFTFQAEVEVYAKTEEEARALAATVAEDIRDTYDRDDDVDDEDDPSTVPYVFRFMIRRAP